MISSLGGYGSTVNSFYLSRLREAENASSADTAKETDDAATRNYSELSTDTLTISIPGRELADLLGKLDGKQYAEKPSLGPPPEPKSEEALAGEIDTKLEAFNSLLMAKLEAAGVDTEQDIELAYDTEGKIVVTSDTEDKELIESLLAEDTVLAESFRELTELSAQAAELRNGTDPEVSPTVEGEQNQSTNPAFNVSGFSLANPSSVASLYAANSNLSSNSLSTDMMQRMIQLMS